MLVPILLATLAWQNPAQPQEPVDAPVFTDSASGISLSRPWTDWVFEPDQGRGTSRVIIFHPKNGSLGDMFWGALGVRSFSRAVPLGPLARQRVTETWQPTLGSSFQLVARDSLTIQGYAAIHLVMSGAINQAALEVEEYLVARGSDLVMLQFRYPRALPHDSLAQGYGRAVRSLRLGPAAAQEEAAPPPAPPAEEAPQESPAPAAAAPREPAAPDTEAFAPPPWQDMWTQLGGSPWRVERVDAAIRQADASGPLSFAVRMQVVNDGLAPSDLLPLWVPPGSEVDSIQLGRAGERVFTGPALADGAALQLPDTTPFQGRATVTVFYRRPFGSGVFIGAWLPATEPRWDSIGRGRATLLPRVTLRFDLPAPSAAVATGRLSADVRGAGRRLMTWIAEDVAAAAPGFVIGPYRASGGTAGRLAVSVWSTGTDLAALDSCAHLVASAWSFDARAFGLAGLPEVTVVVGARATRGLPGLVLLADGAATDPARVAREVARTWWGGSVRGAGPGTAWIDEAFPAFAARAAANPLGSRAPVWRSAATAPLATIVPADTADVRTLRTAGAAALEALRQAIGDAAFRAALRAFAVNHRGSFASADDFLAALPPAGSAALRPYLYGN